MYESASCLFFWFCFLSFSFFFFFFNDTATTEIYTLSLHDALPISPSPSMRCLPVPHSCAPSPRSEEHTSELQSLRHLVCRLLLEKKKKKSTISFINKKKKKIQKTKNKEQTN